MAYSDLDTSIVYTGDGVTVNFPINFSFVEDSQISVEFYDITDPVNPVLIPISNPADWVVSGNSVIFTTAPTSDQQVLVERSTTPINETEYTTYEFPFATANNNIDKVYQLAQENKAALARAIVNPTYETESGNGSTITYEQVKEVVETQLDIQTILDDLQDQIDDNETAINDALVLVADNAADIASNGSAILGNSAAIVSNSGLIATNSSDIAKLQGTIVVRTLAGSFVANANSKQIIKNSGITIQLPASPALNDYVIIKNRGDHSPILDANGGTVDGLASKTIDSAEASVHVLFDGTEWVII